nr:TNF receptor-associated factor 3-like [Rhipicephalus microplus]XP_037290659.1 TNF receptor-associated factor 3-like [Rhipicephalus microplus]
MAELQRVHRFCDHAVEGVNWRPTRFADEVPSSRVCALCRTIPRSTVQLPCSHVMCRSCYAAISQGCGGRCPLDQEQFREAQCVNYDFLTENGNALKVYCWNETRGCEYEGAVEDMLRHFENKCIFHAVECSRCGEAVCHKELATHYMAGCRSLAFLQRE